MHWICILSTLEKADIQTVILWCLAFVIHPTNKMCVLEMISSIECGHTWQAYTEPCAKPGVLDSCRLTQKPFNLVYDLCSSCDNKKRMSQSKKRDPELVFAQYIFDNLALPQFILETRLHYLVPDQLDFMWALRQEARLPIEEICHAETLGHEPSTSLCFGNDSTTSEVATHPTKPISGIDKAAMSSITAPTIGKVVSVPSIQGENQATKGSEVVLPRSSGKGLPSSSEKLGTLSPNVRGMTSKLTVSQVCEDNWIHP